MLWAPSRKIVTTSDWASGKYRDPWDELRFGRCRRCGLPRRELGRHGLSPSRRKCCCCLECPYCEPNDACEDGVCCTPHEIPFTIAGSPTSVSIPQDGGLMSGCARCVSLEIESLPSIDGNYTLKQVTACQWALEVPYPHDIETMGRWGQNFGEIVFDSGENTIQLGLLRTLDCWFVSAGIVLYKSLAFNQAYRYVINFSSQRLDPLDCPMGAYVSEHRSGPRCRPPTFFQTVREPGGTLTCSCAVDFGELGCNSFRPIGPANFGAAYMDHSMSVTIGSSVSDCCDGPTPCDKCAFNCIRGTTLIATTTAINIAGCLRGCILTANEMYVFDTSNGLPPTNANAIVALQRTTDKCRWRATRASNYRLGKADRIEIDSVRIQATRIDPETWRIESFLEGGGYQIKYFSNTATQATCQTPFTVDNAAVAECEAGRLTIAAGGSADVTPGPLPSGTPCPNCPTPSPSAIAITIGGSDTNIGCFICPEPEIGIWHLGASVGDVTGVLTQVSRCTWEVVVPIASVRLFRYYLGSMKWDLGTIVYDLFRAAANEWQWGVYATDETGVPRLSLMGQNPGPLEDGNHIPLELAVASEADCQTVPNAFNPSRACSANESANTAVVGGGGATSFRPAFN